MIAVENQLSKMTKAIKRNQSLKQDLFLFIARGKNWEDKKMMIALTIMQLGREGNNMLIRK